MLRVISLCDGLSGGLLAFKHLGVEVEYHAVEFDKHARNLSDHNFKDQIIRWCHDVTEITKEDIEFHGPFDWIIFGSPCQTLSVGGNGTGFHGKSGLLFDCVKVLEWCREYNPEIKYLIENVKMKQEFLDQFDLIVGNKQRILINSSLMSAQKRERYYWTNFPVSLPEDTGEILYSILEPEVPKEYFRSPKNITTIPESRICWDSSGKGFRSQADRAYPIDGKSPCVQHNRPENKLNIFQFVDKEKAYCIDSNYSKGSYNLKEYIQKCKRQVVFGYSSSSRGNNVIEHRANVSGKSNTLTTGDGCSGGNKTATMVGDFINSELVFRKLTVRECARLQKIPDWYDFSPLSKTQAYKCIGNGWTITVIAHIISFGLGLKELNDEDLL